MARNLNMHSSLRPGAVSLLALGVSLVALSSRELDFVTAPVHRWTTRRTGFLAARASGQVAAAAPERTVVVGGGPAGLATAIALARRGWTGIHVYDRLQEPPDPDDQLVWSDTARFYLIGLGGRGQEALRDLGLWEDVQRYATAVNGRRDWPPGAGPDEGVEQIFTDRPYVTEVLARDRLAGILLRAVRDRHGDAVTVHYGVECAGASWGADDKGTELAILQLQRCASPEAHPLPGQEEGCDIEGATFAESTPLLIGADGATRAIAEAMEADPHHSGVRITRYVDDNVRVYKTVPMKVPRDWRSDINYSARSKDGRVVFDALPADDQGNYCGVLLLRESDPMAQADTSAPDLRALLDEYVPQFSALVTDENVLAIAKRPPSRLPKFRFVGPQLHRGRSTVLLGDAIHTVKPYFGLGANSALEDVSVLSATLDAAGDDVPQALQDFTRRRAKEAKALVQISRALDRPGRLGFITFVLPLILDVVFNKLAPRIFAPNTIAMLQRVGMSFCDVARRKRRDRALQLVILGTAAAAMAKAGIWTCMAVAKLFRLAPGTSGRIAAVASLLVVLAALARGARASKDMAPGDVLAKSRGEVVESDGARKRGRPDNDTLLVQWEAANKTG